MAETQVVSPYGVATRALAGFCEKACPLCILARKKGSGLLFNILKAERHVCPMCKAYEKVNGKPAFR